MDFFYVLDQIISEEVSKGHDIAIYPFGKIGMLANDILNQRYGKKAILIDNKLKENNKKIIDIDDFLKIENKNITMILCVANSNINIELFQDILKKNNGALSFTIKNILEIPVYSPEKEEYFKVIKRLCRVKRVKGYRIIRVGGKNDGGYIMLDDFIPDNIAYSFGIGDDISWDKDISDKGMEVFCYDPTIDNLPEKYIRLNFLKKGISGYDIPNKSLYCINTLLNENKHINLKKMILKMDVEGAEWDFLKKVSSEMLKKFDQMTFELHDITDLNKREKIIDGLKKLHKTHIPIWIHANNNGGSEMAGNICMPRLLEITYANRNSYDFENINYNSPISLDAPNVVPFGEINLTGWGSDDF